MDGTDLKSLARLSFKPGHGFLLPVPITMSSAEEVLTK